MADRICVCGHTLRQHVSGMQCIGGYFSCKCAAFRDRVQAIDQALGKCVEALDRNERKKRSPLYPFENLFAALDVTLRKEALSPYQKRSE